MKSAIAITVNGEGREVPAGMSVAALLTHLSLPAERVAIERNLAILPRTLWEKTPVEVGDKYEIVHFVGGGCGSKSLG